MMDRRQLAALDAHLARDRERRDREWRKARKWDHDGGEKAARLAKQYPSESEREAAVALAEEVL